tara:strand:- start:169 stop:1569 length:1401 start_codon:yes stop_codon:yes gene_type:complete
MDAASKTGVDDIRDLIEFSRYGPSIAKFKIFIIDEVHMLSKQAFNALLKTLEEPPEYLKFIFATTEIKKIPVTIISRCQRFDLSRINSKNLFNFIKKVSEKEKGKINDEALQLIVKISEGSVRDALSLLDRAILNQISKKEVTLADAQKIFGHFDKSYIINLFNYILSGDEKQLIDSYRKIYDQGVEAKVFLNDFLEILYYIKNISSISQDGNNFSLNDEEFKQIEEISKKIETKTIILFWQFTIKSLSELDIVFNQNISMEMFLVRLMHLKDQIKTNKNEITNQTYVEGFNDLIKKPKILEQNETEDNKDKIVNQIKNFSQEDIPKPKLNFQNKSIYKEQKNIIINNLGELIEICNKKKELKLKFELETNVNLVSFNDQKIEISFNENLDRSFVKDLSLKLYEWTQKRWIIAFSKKIGQPTQKEKRSNEMLKFIEEEKKGSTYKKVKKIIPDSELSSIQIIEKDK